MIATATLKEAAFNNLFLRSSTVVTPDTVDKVLDFAELTRSANKLVQELSGSEKGRLVGTLSTFCLADVLIAEKIPSHSNREFQTKLYNAFEKQVENCKFLFLASPNPKIASRICDSVCDLDRKNITINKNLILAEKLLCLVAVSEIKTNQRDIKMRVAFIGAGAMCREHLAALSFVAGVTAVGIHRSHKIESKRVGE